MISKASIITVSYNSGNTIADTINSVKGQDYKNIEHVFIDGGSIDETLAIINKEKSVLNKIISGADKGIYDAMNKGIENSTGNIIGFLNSDDFYTDETIITKIMKVFEDQSIDCVYSNTHLVSENDKSKVVRRWKSSEYTSGSFRKGWHPPFPTFFVRNKVYEQYGNYDITLNVSADFEMMLRLLEVNNLKSKYIDIVSVKMRLGGESTGSLKKIIQGNRNVLKAFRKHNIKVSYLYPLFRLLPKLKQFI
jgi:glycosyltransferase involved in cell wall biosynthesis